MLYSDPYNYRSPYDGNYIDFDWSHFNLMQFLFSDMTVAKMVMYIIAGFIIFMTLLAIGANIKDWIINVYRYSKMGWFQFKYPNYKEKIIKLKFEVYIVGIPSGEVFYVDRKNIRKLKRLRLISWHNGIGYYSFDDENIAEIKRMISPLIFIRHGSSKEVTFDMIDAT